MGGAMKYELGDLIKAGGLIVWFAVAVLFFLGLVIAQNLWAFEVTITILLFIWHHWMVAALIFIILAVYGNWIEKQEKKPRPFDEQAAERARKALGHLESHEDL
jgi:hypothetical protein